MKSVIREALSHYQKNTNRQIDVEEWGVRLSFDPMTMLQRAKVAKKFDAGNLTAAVDVLIMKCKTADGEPAFTYEDEKALLTEVDSAVVMRIAREIMGGAKAGADEVREAEGN